MSKSHLLSPDEELFAERMKELQAFRKHVEKLIDSPAVRKCLTPEAKKSMTSSISQYVERRSVLLADKYGCSEANDREEASAVNDSFSTPSTFTHTDYTRNGFR